MKIFSRFWMLAVAAVAVMSSCAGGGASSKLGDGELSVKNEAKYIFYFIGDGMAAPQIRLAEAALSSPAFIENYYNLTGVRVRPELNLTKLSVTGLATSNALDRYITDSAAAGTALATGQKTNVGMISQLPDGTKIKSVAERAREKGMKVGIVSSVSIDHATPACFYAHTASRNNYKSISDQLIDARFHYFAGGSVKWDKRVDSDDIIDISVESKEYLRTVVDAGFNFVTSKSEFDELHSGSKLPVIATIDLLFHELYLEDGSALPYVIDHDKLPSDENRTTLAQFTQKGIEILDGNEGFFMMVEGGKIDWACHANDAATVAYEVVAFDEAIGVALSFAAAHPTETLIVVTGDHDCGGLTLGFSGTGYKSAFDILAKSKTSFFEFAKRSQEKIADGAKFEELLAFACSEFGFTNDITDGSEGVVSMTSELSDFEVAKLRQAYMKSANRREFSDDEKHKASYGGYDPFTTTCTNILNNKAGIDFTSYSHTALPVMVFAHGENANLFSGYYDNTDVAKRIMLASGF